MKLGFMGKATEPNTDITATTSEFIDKYREPSAIVDEYSNGFRVYRAIDENSFYGLIGTLILGLFITNFIDQHTSYPGDLFYGAIVSLAVYFLVYFLIFRAVIDRLQEHKMSAKTTTYHYCALALERYNESDYEGAFTALKKVTHWIDDDRFDGLHEVQKDAIEAYVEKLKEMNQEERNEALQVTFEPLMSIFAQQTLSIEQSGIDEFQEELTIEGQESSQSAYQFLLEALTDIRYYGPLKGVAPFIGVAVFGLVIFYTVNQQLGMFSVVVLIPIVQYTINRSNSE